MQSRVCRGRHACPASRWRHYRARGLHGGNYRGAGKEEGQLAILCVKQYISEVIICIMQHYM